MQAYLGAPLIASFAGLQAALIFVGFHLSNRAGWLAILGLLAVLAIVAWITAYRRYRAMADVPSSRVLSAAQGYVELCGRGDQHSDWTTRSKLTGLPCLWYHYKIEHRTEHDRNWQVIEQGVSKDSFVLRDDTGGCVIDPDEADVLTGRKSQWLQSSYRYTEHILLPKDKLYVLGELCAVGDPGITLDIKADVAALIAQWKKNPQRLRQRFDSDGDGEIDLKEWDAARREALREVQARQRELRGQEAISVIRAPRDGRLYLISNVMPEKLVRKYRWWGMSQIGVLFAALAALIAVGSISE